MENVSISSFHFPPGIRFHPSDEELIVYYLHNKVKSRPLPAAIIGEIELYSYNPWDLPKKALFGTEEWYFFSPRDRKYPNGARPNRKAASGYWKATGTDKPILNSLGARIGVKKGLVFYIGKPPSGTKSEWFMMEYRLPDTLTKPSTSKVHMRLDDWVLCRIKQKGNMSKNSWEIPRSLVKGLGDAPNLNEQLPPVYAQNPNSSEVCSDYFLSKDCHLLAKLLATDHQDFPSAETENTATSQSSTTSYENGMMNDNIVLNNPMLVSTLKLQGKRGFGHEYETNSPPSKRLNTANDKNNESLFTGTVTTTNDAFFYNQHHQYSNGDGCKFNLSNPSMNLQELDVYTLAQRFLQ